MGLEINRKELEPHCLYKILLQVELSPGLFGTGRSMLEKDRSETWKLQIAKRYSNRESYLVYASTIAKPGYIIYDIQISKSEDARENLR